MPSPEVKGSAEEAGGEPAVAVVTPTKNRLPLLREALDSVAFQTFTKWEHIVVDDGSNDGTREEMTARCLHDPRVRFIERSGPKSGANVCRNIGVRAARADLVVFLDSDDVLAHDCFGARVTAMQRNADLDFAVFRNGVFVRTIGDIDHNADTDLIGDDLMRLLYFEFPWVITGPIWRRSSLIDIGLFDEDLPSWQDVELHIRALAAGKRYLKFPGIDHHIRWQLDASKISTEQRRSPRHLAAAASILDKFEAHIRRGPGMTWSRQRGLCHLHYFVAERWIEAGSLRNALAFWHRIREKRIGSEVLFLSGAALLLVHKLNQRAGARLSNKWKGWARLRTNAELVAN